MGGFVISGLASFFFLMLLASGGFNGPVAVYGWVGSRDRKPQSRQSPTSRSIELFRGTGPDKHILPLPPSCLAAESYLCILSWELNPHDPLLWRPFLEGFNLIIHDNVRQHHLYLQNGVEATGACMSAEAK